MRLPTLGWVAYSGFWFLFALFGFCWVFVFGLDISVLEDFGLLWFCVCFVDVLTLYFLGFLILFIFVIYVTCRGFGMLGLLVLLVFWLTWLGGCKCCKLNVFTFGFWVWLKALVVGLVWLWEFWVLNWFYFGFYAALDFWVGSVQRRACCVCFFLVVFADGCW